MNRKTWDQLISTAGVVLAVALIVLGALAVYGGNFAQSNVTDRLEPQNIVFPPYDAMTPEEQADIGDYAEQQVVERGPGRGVLALHPGPPRGGQRGRHVLGDERRCP